MTRQRTAVTFQTQPSPWAPPVVNQHALPFGVEFQGQLLVVLLDDPFFARAISKYIQPIYFQNEAMSWAWGAALNYQKEYQKLPSFKWVRDQISQLDPAKQPLFHAVLSQAKAQPITDMEWLRARTIDFVRRCIFRQAFQDSKDLFAANKYDAAYDIMQVRMDELRTVNFSEVDRGWYAEEFVERMQVRSQQRGSNVISTGLKDLDRMLGGGAPEGFLGIWVAYPKSGKTTLLTNLAGVAMRSGLKRVLHIVLEGARPMVEARYDAFFMDESYAAVKMGDVDGVAYARAMAEMQQMRGLLVVRGYTDRWDASIVDVEAEMNELKRMNNWDPQMVVVDYGDLLRPRGTFRTETEAQISAFKDIKSLSNRGYVVWTASQARRPEGNEDMKETVLHAKQIADAYGKVRIADFVGSINCTQTEREHPTHPTTRLFAELYRDGPAYTLWRVPTNFSKMTFSLWNAERIEYHEGMAEKPQASGAPHAPQHPQQPQPASQIAPPPQRQGPLAYPAPSVPFMQSYAVPPVKS